MELRERESRTARARDALYVKAMAGATAQQNVLTIVYGHGSATSRELILSRS